MAAASAKEMTPKRQLIAAIHSKDIDTVSKLVKNKGITNPEFETSKNPQPLWPLLEAIEHYDRTILTLLLKAGARADYSSSRFPLPLIVAVKNNNFEAIEILLNHGAYINDIYYESRRPPIIVSPLSMAVRTNNLEMVKFLVEHGADVNFDGRPDYVYTDDDNTDDGSNSVVFTSNNVKKQLPGFETAMVTAIRMIQRNEAGPEILNYLLSMGAKYTDDLGWYTLDRGIYPGNSKVINAFRLEEARQRISEAKRAELGLESIDLPANIKSRISGMFLKEGNIASTTKAMPGPGGPGATGGGSAAAGTTKRRRLTRRKLRR